MTTIILVIIALAIAAGVVSKFVKKDPPPKKALFPKAILMKLRAVPNYGIPTRQKKPKR